MLRLLLRFYALTDVYLINVPGRAWAGRTASYEAW